MSHQRPLALCAYALLALALANALGACARPAVAEPKAPFHSQEGRAALFYARGMAYAEASDFTRAEQYLALALREGHDPELTLRELVTVCVRAARYRSALAYAEPYLLAEPENATLRQLVASIHLALGDAPLAAEELEAVLRSRPDLPDAHYLLGVVLRDHLDRPAQAREHFARYLLLAPEGVHAAEARAALSERPLAARAPRTGRPT